MSRGPDVVSPEWLAEHRDKVIVIDTRDPPEYESVGHVPDAVNVPFQRIRDPAGGTASHLPATEDIERAFGEAGIDVRSDMTSYDTILVPTYGSNHATRAAELGATDARRFGASMHVLSDIDVYEAGGPFSAGGLEEVVVDRLKSWAEDAIEEVGPAIDAPETLETAVRKGNPRDEILAYAAGRGVDLIVMETAGHSGLDRFLLGRTTERVVRQAATPVEAVRTPEKRTE